VDAGVRDSRTDTSRVTAEQTAAEFVINSIKRAGIDVVFGLPGVHALGLFNAVEKAGMRYVGLRHEQAAAHAADGFGRATGKPGVVLLSTGPGALNALSGLGEAYVSSSPVLALTSAIPSHLQDQSKGFLHEAKDLAPAFASVTRFSGRARTLGEIPAVLENALTTTMATRPGPALVELPVDLIDAPFAEEPIVLHPDRPVGADEVAKLEQAAWLISMAARPVIWAGGGVIRAGASPELVQIAERVDAPVVTSFMGKGSFPEDHPLAVGCMVRQPETQELLRDSDVMLAVGTRFTAMATSQWKIELPSQLIHIDADPSEIGRNYPVRLGIAGHAKAALEVILDGLDSQQSQKDGAGRTSRARHAAFERARGHGPRELAFIESIRAALDPGIVTVHDMTIPSYWSWPFFPVYQPRTFHSPYGFGSLGFSLPAAIGVAAADPHTPVVAFCGDGGFQYHGRELATIEENSLPVITLVFNDRAWGVLKAFSDARYESAFGLDLPGPDFVMLASAYRIPAWQATEPDELEKRLREAVDLGGPALIEVPGEWKLPPPTDYYR
jgi:thiamine pyrophosphate-dependent acetolactate synthase large subunit-like protein